MDKLDFGLLYCNRMALNMAQLCEKTRNKTAQSAENTRVRRSSQKLDKHVH